MESKLTSHQFAAELRKLAEQFEAQAAVPLPSLTLVAWVETKEELAKIARIMPKPIEKDWPAPNERYGVVKLRSHCAAGFDMELAIWRDRVCRKVQDEVWECEPKLLRDELEAIA